MLNKQPNQKKQGKCEKQKYFNTVGADIFDKEIRRKKKKAILNKHWWNAHWENQEN